MTRLSTPLTVRYGTPRQRAYVTNRAKAGMSIAERVMLHVQVNDTGCWVWQLAPVPGTGYGSLTVNRKALRAHRASYEAFVGPIPEGLQLDHLCRNRLCVNPEHLEPVTARVNMRRGESPGAKAQRRELCQYGIHPYSEFGAVWSGRRHCRGCRKIYSKLYRSMTPDEREDRKARGLEVVDLGAYYATKGQAA